MATLAPIPRLPEKYASTKLRPGEWKHLIQQVMEKPGVAMVVQDGLPMHKAKAGSPAAPLD